MSDKKISALTAATTPLAGSEVLPIVQGGTTKKVAVSDVAALATVNLTGPITSVGAATAIASQTGTGSTFVMSVSPTLTGTIAGASQTLSGTLGVTGVATLTAAPVFSSATASLPMFTDGSKALVSNAMTGTGSVVMSASPTLTGTIAGANQTLSGTLGVTGVATLGNGAILNTPASMTGTNITGTAAGLTAGNVTNAFATGTVMLFVQTAAPTGWTKSTTHDNKALRVVSGSITTGGSVAFTTAFASQAVSGSVGTSGATTLSTAQIPSHTHVAPGVVLWGAAVTGVPDLFCGTTTAANSGTPTSTYYGPNTGAAGGGGSHDHSGGTFTGTAINLAVQYVDVIIATKD